MDCIAISLCLVVFVTTVAASGMEEDGSCLLSQRSRLNRIATFDEQAEEHHAWRSEHVRLLRVVNQSSDKINHFIEAQNDSKDACSARLVQEKRALDGLLADLKALSAQVSSHEEVLETETQNLKIVNMSIAAVEQTYAEMIGKCNEKHEEALRDVSQYSAELAELNQIANPAVRYSHTVKSNITHSLSLLEDSTTWWGETTCKAFLNWMNLNPGPWGAAASQVGLRQHENDTALVSDEPKTALAPSVSDEPQSQDEYDKDDVDVDMDMDMDMEPVPKSAHIFA